MYSENKWENIPLTVMHGSKRGDSGFFLLWGIV